MSKKIWFRRHLIRNLLIAGMLLTAISGTGLLPPSPEDVFNGHKVILDDQHKIIPWSVPIQNAYDHFLRLRWDFIYTSTQRAGTEYLRLAFRPTRITLAGVGLSLRRDLDAKGYTLRSLRERDYAVNIRRMGGGQVVIR